MNDNFIKHYILELAVTKKDKFYLVTQNIKVLLQVSRYYYRYRGTITGIQVLSQLGTRENVGMELIKHHLTIPRLTKVLFNITKIQAQISFYSYKKIFFLVVKVPLFYNYIMYLLVPLFFTVAFAFIEQYRLILNFTECRNPL